MVAHTFNPSAHRKSELQDRQGYIEETPSQKQTKQKVNLMKCDAKLLDKFCHLKSTLMVMLEIKLGHA